MSKTIRGTRRALSAALFLLGLAINDADADDDQDDLVSTPSKMEIEVDLEEEGRVIDVSDDVDIISNDSNKCQCIPLSIVDPPKTPNPIRKRPKTSNKFGRGERRGGNLKSTGAVGMILSAPESEATDNDDPEAVAEDNNGVASTCNNQRDKVDKGTDCQSSSQEPEETSEG